jgi:hypothetical protein
VSGGCHVAVSVSPNGRPRNVVANEKECGFPDDQREVGTVSRLHRGLERRHPASQERCLG